MRLSLIFLGIAGIYDTWRHEGPGIVSYVYSSDKEVSEEQYKRHHYISSGALLIIAGVVFLGCAARKAGVKNYQDE